MLIFHGFNNNTFPNSFLLIILILFSAGGSHFGGILVMVVHVQSSFSVLTDIPDSYHDRIKKGLYRHNCSMHYSIGALQNTVFYTKIVFIFFQVECL